MKVIRFILDGERSFSEILELFDLDKSAISKQMLVMKESGAPSSRKVGRGMIHRLEEACVANFFSCATAVVQNKVEKQLQGLAK